MNVMNLFRKDKSEELELKLSSYETQINELENHVKGQDEKIQSLIDTVQSLTNTVEVKDIELEEKELVLEEKEVVIESQEVLIDKQEEIIQEVIDNTITVEKQAAIQALVILSELGVDTVETIDGPEEVDLMAQMKKLKGQELTNFYNENKQSIFRTIKKD